MRQRDFPELETSAAEQLRISLHLNVALCALKRKDYYLAREACSFVLSKQPDEPKALFRLAQALVGSGEPEKASKPLTRLVQQEPTNKEARRLLAELREQLKAQRALFQGVCGKKGFVQPDEPTQVCKDANASLRKWTSSLHSPVTALLAKSRLYPNPRTKLNGVGCLSILCALRNPSSRQRKTSLQAEFGLC